MGGMEMMMKSLGFDPENIKNQIAQAGEDFKAVVTHFNKRGDVTDVKLKEIDEKLDYLISCLKPVDMLVNTNVVNIPHNSSPAKFSPEIPKGD